MRDENKSREQLIRELVDLRQQLAARGEDPIAEAAGEAATRRRVEERLRAIVDHSATFIYLKDLAGSFLLVNKQFEVAFHQSEAGLLGKTDFDIHATAEQARAVRANDLRVIETGGPVEFEEVVQLDDGPHIFLSVKFPVRDSNGAIYATGGISTDITERGRADEERERLLREVSAQRQYFQAVVEHAPAGIALLRPPDFAYELVNPAYRAIGLGISMEGKTVAQVFPDLAQQVLPILEDVVRTGVPYHAVDRRFQIRRAPEAAIEDVYFTFSYEPMLDAEGRVDLVLVLVVETTQQVLIRRRVEELADVAQRRAFELQAVLDNMVDAVFVCTPDGRITLSNPAATRMFGLPGFDQIKSLPAEFPTLFRLRHPDGRPIESSEMATARALKGETVVDSQQVFHSSQLDRDRYVRVSASPIRDAEGNVAGAVVVARDVTALTELDRLKDEFLTVAAHELKTPVTIMKGYAQALERASFNLPQPARRMIDAIDHGADRIDRIVKDLLDITRLQAGQLELADERVDLPGLAAEVVDRFALTTTSRHRMRVVQADQAVVRGDRSRIGEVLADLLDNAVRYSPAGGDVDVAVRVSDDRAVVSVRDQGVGVPREKQARIFERFYRAHTRTQYDYGGMGVGLYIAREVIARHGGETWFESEEGKGSTFYFSLPLTRA